jgi:hypothetical protein
MRARVAFLKMVVVIVIMMIHSFDNF